MKKIFLVPCLLTLFLHGCSKQFPGGDYNMTNDSSVIPIEDALETLEEFSSSIYGETKTRTRDFSVAVFGGIQTKSGKSLPDTSLYIVNYGNDCGFAILAAQQQMSSKVFCLTESGKIDANDFNEAYNELLQSNNISNINNDDSMFYDTGEQFLPMLLISAAINQMEHEDINVDSTVQTKSGYYYTHQKYGPLTKTKWRQRSPFNNFRTDNAPAGCVAIATAQILQCIKYGNPDNMNFSWDKLATVCNTDNPAYPGTAEAQKEASRLAEYLGLHKNCRIKYGVNGSSGNSYGAKRALQNFGYPTVKRYIGFNDADQRRVRECLFLGKPVYVDGNSGNSGHAWVIDGMWVRTLYADSQFVRTDTMYHVNWGWNGQADGYYDYGVFSTTARKAIEHGIDSGSTISGDFNYTWDFHTVIYSF